MGADAPQWLVSSFVDSLAEVGATASTEQAENEAEYLIGLWNAPGRAAHNIRHLIHVLSLIDELSSTAHDPEILRLAAWYHGAGLSRDRASSHDAADPSATTPTCADAACEHLRQVGTPEPIIERIVELLSCMSKHYAGPGDSDAQVLVDADLGRLASSPQEFAKYREKLREEYADMDDLSYYQARRRAVRQLLDRDTIFFTDHGSEWEDVARSNLEIELARLGERIRSLNPQTCIDSGETDEPSFIPTRSSQTPVPDNDEDLISDKSVHATHATVIKRRSIKTKPTQEPEQFSTTGILPRIVLPPTENAAHSRMQAKEDDADMSSLETAVDALGIP